MNEEEILIKALQKANMSSDLPYNSAIGEILTEVVILQGFAKALWGYGKGVRQYDVVPEQDAWQYHLQKMVIAENAIKYLGNNI